MVAFVIVSFLTMVAFVWFFSKGISYYIAFLLHFVCWFRLIATFVSEYGQLYNALWLFLHFGLFGYAMLSKKRVPLIPRFSSRFNRVLSVFVVYLGLTIFYFGVLTMSEIALVYALFFTGVPLLIYATNYSFKTKDEHIIIGALYSAGLVQVIIGLAQICLSKSWPGFYQFFVIEYQTLGGGTRGFLESELAAAAKFPIGTLGRYNNYAMFLSLYAILLLTFPKRYRSIVPRLAKVRWPLLAVVLALIYLSNSRLSLIGLIASLALYYAFTKFSIRKFLLIALGMALAFLVVPNLVQNASAPQAGATISQRAEQPLSDVWRQALAFDENFANGRIFWAGGFILLFLQNPLFGHGAGSYSIHPDYSLGIMGPGIASNEYLFDTGYIGLTAELGIFGMLIFIQMILVPLMYQKKIRSLFNNDPSALVDFNEIRKLAVMTSLCVLIMTTVNTGLFLRHINVFYYAIMALPFLYARVRFEVS